MIVPLTKSLGGYMHPSAPHAKRLDIQGLRAVAVLAVVFNHLIAFPNGGFVGVDIFFVISGFVITIGLIREHENTGSISFKNFYFRRIARIMPAGTLAIIVTIVAGYFAFFNERANSILIDGVAAFFFSANWRFAVNGTDYWAEDSPVSPLQHYWSLGVEEQFYFVWPLLALLVLSLAARSGMKHSARRTVLASVLAVLIVLSFLWAVAETSSNASWAYFSTASRVWELGVGALLAVIAPLFSNLPQVARKIMGWTGIIGMAVSLAAIDKTFAFPAPWAALPVGAAALVIISGTNGIVPGFGFLTNRASVYIGNISYSLYLWHFPVIIIMGALWPAEDAMFLIAAIVLMAFLAVASYEFVELPSQRAITSLRSNGFRHRSAKSLTPRNTKRLGHFGLSAMAAAAVILVPAAFQHTAPVEANYIAVPVQPSNEPTPTAETNASRLSASINEALAAESWPELTPSLGNLLEEGRPDEDGEGCGNTDLEKPNCVFGTDKAETIVVLGDSTGITLLPTVRHGLGDTYNVRGMTKAGCIVLDTRIEQDRPEATAECETFKTAAISKINELRPAMVIVSNRASSISSAEWQGGTQRLLEALKPSGAELVVVSPPPSGTPPADCATRTSQPRDCVYQIPQNFYVAAEATLEATQAADAKFIDTRSWFCNDQGYCPAFAGETLLKRDNIHTTKQYALTVTPAFMDALEG